MSTFTTTTKHSATYTNVNKTIPTSDSTYQLLIDDTYFFLIDDIYKFLIGEDSSSSTFGWTNLTKS